MSKHINIIFNQAAEKNDGEIRFTCTMNRKVILMLKIKQHHL
jgi:hypothetical protein